ncbi:MAG: T9SS type A sorting domain-containing protein, partial [Bacteroidales bacterium]|nr:T9SS type A sorting domain-containing protein [Bacteroidales bacterium]
AVKSVGVIDITAIDWTMGQNIPNPASTITKVPYNVPQEGTIVFKVMSINGQLLYKEDINASAGSQYLELNTDNLSNGIYYYSMEYKGQRIVKKLTIQK